MKKFPFTKGSWGIRTEDPTQIVVEDCMLVATVTTPDDFPCFDPEDHGSTWEEWKAECEANARLIAAAPALFAYAEFEDRFNQHFERTGREIVTAVEFWKATEELLPEVGRVCPPLTPAEGESYDNPQTEEEWAEARSSKYGVDCSELEGYIYPSFLWDLTQRLRSAALAKVRGEQTAS